MMNGGGISGMGGGGGRPVSWPSRTSVSSSGKRIQAEIAELNMNPPVDSSASPKGDNLYHWIATIIGPPDSSAVAVPKFRPAMAVRSLLKSATAGRLSQIRNQSYLAATKQQHEQTHHVYENPNKYIGSWKSPPRDPKEAELAMLRRDYSKRMKEIRKVYIDEMELQRLEKKRKEAAKKEATMKANEERRKLKAAAAERKVADEQFRQALKRLELLSESEYLHLLIWFPSAIGI